MVAYAERMLGVAATLQGSEYRLPGNNGFLINPIKGCWYKHGTQEGGDAFDLVGYFLYGPTWNKRDPDQFKRVLGEAAEIVGIWLPVYSQSMGSKARNPSGSVSLDPVVLPEQAPKADLLDVAQAWQKQYAKDLTWDATAQTWRHWTGTHWHEEHEAEFLDLMTAHLMRAMDVPVSRPKLRDTLMGVRSGIMSTKRRVLDSETSEIKPLWGLSGIRLRRPDDPDDNLDDSRPTVPQPFQKETDQESSDDAICSGVPSESETSRITTIENIQIPLVKAEKDQREAWNTGTIPDTAPQLSVIRDGTGSDATAVHGQSHRVLTPATPAPDDIGANYNALTPGLAVDLGVTLSSKPGDIREANGVWDDMGRQIEVGSMTGLRVPTSTN